MGGKDSGAVVQKLMDDVRLAPGISCVVEADATPVLEALGSMGPLMGTVEGA